MMTLIRKSWLSLFGRRETNTGEQASAAAREPAYRAQPVDFDIAPNDPLLAYLLSVSSVVEVDALQLSSPSLEKLKQAGVKVVVPLISQGELIGLLNLGPRRSEQEYSADDRRLLNTLAAQAAPALRVAQMARQQQAEARERERIAQELRVARVIQQTLLPKEIPSLPGWKMAAHWQPARAVSGDFYDFITFPDGRIAVIVGDVTDKGVPAALVMATTRSILRASAERLVLPGAVLEQANNNLCPDIPPNMFVTCLYLLLDPATGKARYANAGHNLPYQRSSEGVLELRARGMPLGLMPGMVYEEKETILNPGDYLILYSDGIVEAHNSAGEMFGFPRLRQMLARPECGSELIPCMVGELSAFTGPDWEQEDDVTFVSLERSAAPDGDPQDPGEQRQAEAHPLASFEIPSQAGNERLAMERVAAAVEPLQLSQAQLERLKTAVAETTMNAIEHGNQFNPDKPVRIEVTVTGEGLVVQITDYGENQDIPDPEAPDLDAKLAGLQSPRGWGLFLIRSMVDEMRVAEDTSHHTVELVIRLQGGSE